MKALHDDPAYLVEVEKLKDLKRAANDLDARETAMREKVRPIRGDTANADIVARALAVAHGEGQQAVATVADLQHLNAERAIVLKGIEAQEALVTDAERQASHRAAGNLAPKLRDLITKIHRHAQALMITNSALDELRAEFESAGYRGNTLPHVGLFNSDEAAAFAERVRRYITDAEEQLRLNGFAAKADAKAA